MGPTVARRARRSGRDEGADHQPPDAQDARQRGAETLGPGWRWHRGIKAGAEQRRGQQHRRRVHRFDRGVDRRGGPLLHRLHCVCLPLHELQEQNTRGRRRHRRRGQGRARRRLRPGREAVARGAACEGGPGGRARAHTGGHGGWGRRGGPCEEGGGRAAPRTAGVVDPEACVWQVGPRADQQRDAPRRAGPHECHMEGGRDEGSGSVVQWERRAALRGGAGEPEREHQVVHGVCQ
mmetsp:Transcript_90198/g.291588  ORF Transcript_90198/g.291588 Transcript_90198/m.291588 type:complete len:236 (-) Transcript_90198:616-1323(-)